MPIEYAARIEETLNMFAFLAAELTVLFLAVSYLVGVLQEFITPEKIRSVLGSKNGKGYIVAALLGAITPFCSCSTIPFLKGLLKARAGFGPMMVFLLASPLLNPIVIGLLIVTFGLDVAIFYFVLAMAVSVFAGVILEKLGFERYVRKEAYDEPTSCKAEEKVSESTDQSLSINSMASSAIQNVAASVSQGAVALEGSGQVSVSSGSSCGVDASGKSTCGGEAKSEPTQPSRWTRIWNSTWKDFKNTLPYLLLGITLGSLIYGFVPTELIVTYAGENKWYAVPVAAVIGIPLYIRASAVIPLSAGLVQKGMAMGSVLALIIGSAGASLTEVILLKSIFKTQMIAAFLTVVLGMAVTAGYLYSFIF